MSVFSTVGMMFMDITIFQTGMFFALFAFCFGLARMITKDSKILPVLFTTFASFIGMIMLSALQPEGAWLVIAGAIGTTLWFILIWKRKDKENDLEQE